MKPPTPELLERRRELGLQIRHLLRGHGVSHEELPHLAGLDHSYIGAVERGERKLGVDNLHRIADALGRPVRELF